MEQEFYLEEIRAKERRSHEEIYTKDVLYQDGSWLSKPIKTVTQMYPLFDSYQQLRILDLGCGVGRNCIATAEYFRDKDCRIDCVDILELAIKKLTDNAIQRKLSHAIFPAVCGIDDFPIPENSYDWIMTISALEHMNSEASMLRKLLDIRNGIRIGGITTLVINSEVREYDKIGHVPIPAQFEVNLKTERLQKTLCEIFDGWLILKSTVSTQCYDIPRDGFVSELHSQVITFSARK